jgi:alkanesulfonate monooxygenase SsuD/methylene tetrahydromethanopterin reductase-like flavin-dependent oxidoreductase (luciferase family)
MIFDTEFNSAAQVSTQICVRAAELAEERGFGCVWKGESNSRDPLVLLSAYAARTSRIDVGTAIYHMYGRSPITLAIQAATLNELSDGRLILGLGIGNPTIAAWHGETYTRPLRRIREYVEIVRLAYSGERADYEGEFFSSRDGFRLAFRPPPYPLRLWLAALGEQMCTLAGKISDGVMINMASPDRVSQIAAWAREGAVAAGRDPAGLEIVPKLRVAIHEDPAMARRALKKVLTFYSLQEGYGQMLEAMGFTEEVARVREVHRESGFRAAWDQVPDSMLDGVPMYAGSDLDGLPERLRPYEEAGATRMNVAFVPSGEDVIGEIERFVGLADFVGAGV